MEREQKTLRDWLEARDNMTQQDLAIATGMHVSSIGGIIAGRIRPRKHTRAAIARALHVSPDQVLWPAIVRPYPSTAGRYTGAKRGPKPRAGSKDTPSKILAPVA